MPINRHDRLRDDELTSRYRRLRNEEPTDRHSFFDEDPYEHVDEYWDAWNSATALDFHLQRVWEQVLAVAFTPSVASFLSESIRDSAARAPADPAPAPAFSADELPEALRHHLEVAISRTSRHDTIERLRDAGTLDDVRTAVHNAPVLGRWFASERGPAVMALVLAPFWIRPLSAWVPPADREDLDAVTVSLVDHLFVQYPLPKPLYRAWTTNPLPILKWACWTVLLGRGASLHRAAPRFGWHVTSRFMQHLLAAPGQLEPVEAVMWAEVARLGGSTLEYARLSAHPGYRIDPTAVPDAAAGDDEWDERAQFGTAPDFWRATVGWLARHREALTDDADCQLILDWAMHRHTEDVVHQRRESECFSWHGREPDPALAEATRYRDLVQGRHRAGRRDGRPLTWRRRGWDWEETRGDDVWIIRELTSDTELAREGQTMRHCVASYSYACALGQSAIFSVTHNNGHRATVQLDVRGREIVQARGPRNRPCDRDELDALERWLATIK